MLDAVKDFFEFGSGLYILYFLLFCAPFVLYYLRRRYRETNYADGPLSKEYRKKLKSYRPYLIARAAVIWIAFDLSLRFCLQVKEFQFHPSERFLSNLTIITYIVDAALLLSAVVWIYTEITGDSSPWRFGRLVNRLVMLCILLAGGCVLFTMTLYVLDWFGFALPFVFLFILYFIGLGQEQNQQYGGGGGGGPDASGSSDDFFHRMRPLPDQTRMRNATTGEIGLFVSAFGGGYRIQRENGEYINLTRSQLEWGTEHYYDENYQDWVAF